MRIGTVWKMVSSGQARVLAVLERTSRPFFLLSFLGTASREGVLELLAGGARTATEIAEALRLKGPADALEAWLQVGASVGALQEADGRWALGGFFARALAQPEHRPLAALVWEFVSLHHALIVEGPRRLREDRGFRPEETDAELIALTSRTTEPFVQDVLRVVLEGAGGTRLLEIGCGSGTHIHFAAGLDPGLTALGLELSEALAGAARENLQRWGLGERARVEVGNLLERAPEPAFDLVTMHQNIYYFPVGERAAVLRRAASWLAPGGRLLITTACRAPAPGFALMNLWGSMTEGAGRLPDAPELAAAFGEAGLTEVRTINPLAPAGGFVGVVGTRR